MGMFVDKEGKPIHRCHDCGHRPCACGRPCGYCGGDGGAVVGPIGDCRWWSCEQCHGTGMSA